MNNNIITVMTIKLKHKLPSLKIILPTLLTASLFILAFFYILIPAFETSIMNGKREMIKELTSSAFSILERYNNLLETGDITRPEAQKNALNEIESMRYGTKDKDYFWIIDTTPIMIMHPYRKDLIGQNVLNYTDINGKKFFIEFINIAKEKGEGYSDYMWQLNDDPGQISLKVSFLKKFKPWSWIIGTGVYVEDVKTETKKLTDDITKISLIIIFIIFLTLLFINWQSIKLENQRLAAVNKLQKSEEFRKRIFESSPIPIVVMDAATSRYIDCNPAAVKIYGFPSKKETLGKTPLDFSAPFQHDGAPSAEKAVYYMNLAKTNESTVFEWRHQRPNNEIWDAEVHLLFFSVDEVQLLQFSIIDITERKLAETALKHSEATYREIFNSVNDAIFIHDINTGAILDVNIRMLEMFGYSYEESLKLTIGELSSGNPLYTQERAVELVKKAVAGKPQIFEWHCRHKNGKLIWVEVSLKRGIIAGNERILALVRNITERKQEKESLLRTQFAMDKAKDSILWIGDDGSIVYANDSACSSMRYAREELLKLKVFDIDPDFPLDNWEEHKKEMRRLGTMSFESRHITKEGRVFPVEISSNYFEFDNGFMACAFDRDISDRKKAEEALRKSNDRLQTVLNSIDSMIYIADMKTHEILFVNNYFENNWSKNIIGLKCWKALQELDEPCPFCTNDKLLTPDGNPTGVYQWEFQNKVDGRWYDIKDRAILWTDGSFVRMEVATDITERKNAEQALRESEERFSTAFKSSPAPLVISEIDSGEIIDVNENWCKLLGYNREEQIGRTSKEISMWANNETRDFQIQILKKSGSFKNASTIFKSKNGKYIDALWSAEIITLNGRKVILSMIYDETERKKAEEALRENEEKLSALFESMTEMVVLHDVVFDENGVPENYRITDCNNAYIKLIGIDKKEIIGKLATEAYEIEKPLYLDEFSRVALTGEPYDFESFFATINKHLTISVVSPGKNKFATIITDTTNIKQAQQIITDKNKELEQIIYVASHDLRSPLVNVEGYSRELELSINKLNVILENEKAISIKLKRALNLELPEMSQALTHIRSSARQMDALLKGLLMLSRSGRASLTINTLDMNNLIARVVSTLEFQIKESRAELCIGDLPSCKGDQLQITQVFTNLIGNALKFLDPKRHGIIKISGESEYNRSIYCVEDNGIGIDQKHLNKIFELFYRLNPSKTEGEGLGLTIVKQILNRLNGEIRVESEPGEGSRFYVSLPFAKTK